MNAKTDAGGPLDYFVRPVHHGGPKNRCVHEYGRHCWSGTRRSLSHMTKTLERVFKMATKESKLNPSLPFMHTHTFLICKAALHTRNQKEKREPIHKQQKGLGLTIAK